MKKTKLQTTLLASGLVTACMLSMGANAVWAGPDLTLTGGSFSKSPNNMNAVCVIKNIGNQASSACKVEFEFENGTTTVATRNLAALAAGASLNVSQTINGTSWTSVTITADSAFDVTENSENNNHMTFGVSLVLINPGELILKPVPLRNIKSFPIDVNSIVNPPSGWIVNLTPTGSINIPAGGNAVLNVSVQAPNSIVEYPDIIVESTAEVEGDPTGYIQYNILDMANPLSDTIPTMGEWSLIIMSCLVFGAGAWFIKRRK